MPGLDIASCYVAASDSQQVGGDWFDLFDLEGGRTAVVIGDVVGHDIEAAAAMAQVRAALRAYAVEDDGPLPVVERLAHLVDRFDVAGLVTVVYGVLGAPTSGGARQFDWANAGHPSPLVVLPNGQVQELGEGRSRVIGAPGSEPRDQGRALLSAGSFLLLYTDGLVERPGTDLSVSTSQLRSCLEQQPPGRSANELCAAVLAAKPIDQTRDDIAIVVIRLLPAVVTEGVSLRLDHPAEAAAVSGAVPAARQRKAPSGQRALAERPIVLDSDVAYDVVPPTCGPRSTTRR